MEKQNGEKKQEKQVRICPKCGSTDVEWDHESMGIARIFMSRACCRNCGLKGKFPTIPENKINDFKRMLNK